MRSILKLTAMLLPMFALSACFTIGKVGYLEPTLSEGPGRNAGTVVGKHCQTAAIDIVTKSLKTTVVRSGQSTWENVTLTYKPEGLKGCVIMYKNEGGSK